MSEDFKFENIEKPSFNIMNLYFSPKGRIGRANYWIGGIPLAIVCLAAEYFVTEESTLFYLAIILPSAYMGLILNIKRAHDRGRSGWFTLFLFVPIISFWPTIELGFFKGTEGPNSFGPDPVTSSETVDNQSFERAEVTSRVAE